MLRFRTIHAEERDLPRYRWRNALQWSSLIFLGASRMGDIPPLHMPDLPVLGIDACSQQYARLLVQGNIVLVQGRRSRSHGDTVEIQHSLYCTHRSCASVPKCAAVLHSWNPAC